MRTYKIVQEEVLEKLADVFRENGYDGASLNLLADAAGLKKASLYHRFPRGKQQMGEEVLAHLEKWADRHIFHFLFKKGDAVERRDEALGSILIFYDHGRKNCLLSTMNLGSGMSCFGEVVNRNLKRWVDGFTRLGIDFGMSAWKARELATRVVVKIQGALVLAKGLENGSVFLDTLNWIKKQYVSNKHSVVLLDEETVM